MTFDPTLTERTWTMRTAIRARDGRHDDFYTGNLISAFESVSDAAPPTMTGKLDLLWEHLAWTCMLIDSLTATSDAYRRIIFGDAEPDAADLRTIAEQVITFAANKHAS